MTHDEETMLMRIHDSLGMQYHKGYAQCEIRMSCEVAYTLVNVIAAALPPKPITKKVKMYRFTYTRRGSPWIAQDELECHAIALRNTVISEGDAWDISEITEHEQEVTKR